MRPSIEPVFHGVVMKFVSLLSLAGSALLALACAPAASDQASAAEAPFSFPAEWEQQAAVWIGWPEPVQQQDPWLARMDAAHEEVRVQLIGEMLSGSRVTILVPSEEAEQAARQRLSAAELDLGRIDFHRAPVEDFVVRDAGPRFLSNGRELRIADIAWNCYNYPSEIQATAEDCARRADNDNSVATARGLATVVSDVVSEGGGLEVTGDLLMGYRDTALQRNPGRSIEEIERAYLDVYGKQKMIWLQRSPPSDRPGQKIGRFFGWGANGHVDEFVRFVDEKTVLVAQVGEEERDADALARADHEVLAENWTDLEQATTVAGEPLRLIAMPAANPGDFAAEVPYGQAPRLIWPDLETEFDDEDLILYTPTVSYLNFVITNDKIIVAAYWQEGMDESIREKDLEAQRILAEVFPARKVVAINPLPFNWYGGGMHCATQQEPALGGP